MIKNNKTQFKQTELGKIPKDWDIIQVKDYCKTIQYGYTQSASKKEIGPKFLRITDIQNRKIDWNQVPFCKISEKEKQKYLLNDDDIVIARTGASTGACGYYKNNMPKSVFASYLIRIKTKKELNSQYLYQILKSNFYKKFIEKILAGSAQPNANAQELTSVKIPFPLPTEQQKIADVLGSLDDKIELLEKQNQTLESLGQTIFKKWFIDLESATAYRLGQFFKLKTGKKDANFSSENGKYPFFTCSQKNLKADSYSFDCSALLLAGNGDFSIKWYEGKFEAYQRTYILEPHKKEDLGLIYFMIKFHLKNLTAGHRGSVIHFLTKSMIEDYIISMPDKIDHKVENNINFLYSLLQFMDINIKQIQTLSQIRDLLLPKLISGKVRVR